MLWILLLSGCTGDEVTLPSDLPGPGLAACLQPIPAWTSEAAAFAALNQQELVVRGTVVDAGAGDPPECSVPGDWALWADADGQSWIRVEEDGGKEWVVGIDGAEAPPLPGSGPLTVRYRVYFPAGRDEVPRGYLQLEDDAGLLLWAGRHIYPASASPPSPFTWSDGDDSRTYRAPGCGRWTERTMRVGHDGGSALLARGEASFPPGWSITSAGNARVADTSAWSCPEDLADFGAEVWIQRDTEP